MDSIITSIKTKERLCG